MDYPAQATFYVRLSLMLPKAGRKDRVIELHEQVLAGLPGTPGFIRGYLLVSGDPQGRIGHLNVWRSEQDADQAAQTQHVMSVRSELLQVIEEDSHVERSYTAYDPQLAQQPASGAGDGA
jgi:quinol monooxygenase YgiN